MQSQGTLKQTQLLEQIKEYGKRRWESLSEKQKALAQSSWKIITYKWQWQIALNAPFLFLWVLDRTIPAMHEFDMKLLASLPIPTWLAGWLGTSGSN